MKAAPLLVLAIVATAGCGRPRVDSARQISRWREAGFPWTEAELAPRPPRVAGDAILHSPFPGDGPVARARELSRADGYAGHFFPAYRPEQSGQWEDRVQRRPQVVMDYLTEALLESAKREIRAGRTAVGVADFAATRRIVDAISRQPDEKSRRYARNLEFNLLGDAARMMTGRPLAVRRAIHDAVVPRLVPTAAEDARARAVRILREVRMGGERANGWPRMTGESILLNDLVDAWIRIQDETRNFEDERAFREARARLNAFPEHSVPPAELFDDIKLLKTRAVLLRATLDGPTATHRDAWDNPILWQGDFPYSFGLNGRNDGGDPNLDLYLTTVKG